MDPDLSDTEESLDICGEYVFSSEMISTTDDSETVILPAPPNVA